MHAAFPSATALDPIRHGLESMVALAGTLRSEAMLTSRAAHFMCFLGSTAWHCSICAGACALPARLCCKRYARMQAYRCVRVATSKKFWGLYGRAACWQTLSPQREMPQRCRQYLNSMKWMQILLRSRWMPLRLALPNRHPRRQHSHYHGSSWRALSALGNDSCRTGLRWRQSARRSAHALRKLTRYTRRWSRNIFAPTIAGLRLL